MIFQFTAEPPHLPVDSTNAATALGAVACGASQGVAHRHQSHRIPARSIRRNSPPCPRLPSREPEREACYSSKRDPFVVGPIVAALLHLTQLILPLLRAEIVRRASRKLPKLTAVEPDRLTSTTQVDLRPIRWNQEHRRRAPGASQFARPPCAERSIPSLLEKLVPDPLTKRRNRCEAPLASRTAPHNERRFARLAQRVMAARAFQRGRGHVPSKIRSPSCLRTTHPRPKFCQIKNHSASSMRHPVAVRAEYGEIRARICLAWFRRFT